MTVFNGSRLTVLLVGFALLVTACGSDTSTVDSASPSSSDGSTESRFFDEDASTDSYFTSSYSAGSLAEFADYADLVFVGHVTGVSRDVFTEEPTEEDLDGVVTTYDGVEFAIDEVVSGSSDTKSVTVAHPVMMVAEQSQTLNPLVRVPPIDELRAGIEGEAIRYLVFTRIHTTEQGDAVLVFAGAESVTPFKDGKTSGGLFGPFRYFAYTLDDVRYEIETGLKAPTADLLESPRLED